MLSARSLVAVDRNVLIRQTSNDMHTTGANLMASHRRGISLLMTEEMSIVVLTVPSRPH
jgi:hypothetical protein